MHPDEAPEYANLMRHSLFGGVTEDAYRLIRPMIRMVQFESGQTIVREGRVNDRIYFITSGSVEVVKECESGDTPRLLTTMGEGDTFGEMELIDIQPCAASVRALEDTTTLTLSNRDLYRLSKLDMKTYALLIMNLAREISRRLRATDTLLADSPRNDGSSDGDAQ